MQAKNSNQLKEMYTKMGVTIEKLGCIMLDLDGGGIPNLLKEEELYFTTHPDRFWIKGFVVGEVPHLTLLYGLMESGNVYKEYVDEVLKEWECDSIEIDHVGYFNSPYPDENYYCIIAHVKVTDPVKQANQALQLLPHINTFPDYSPHMTIAYIKADEEVRDRVINQYNDFFGSQKIQAKRLNYGN